MIKNSLGVVLSPGGLAAAERSEGSVCELERSAAAAKVGAGAVPVLPPDSEVVAKAKRRVFTAAYKLRIVQEPFSPEFGVKRINEWLVDVTGRHIAEGRGAYIFIGMSRPKPKE